MSEVVGDLDKDKIRLEKKIPQHISGESNGEPVDDFKERNEAESKTKTKESSNVRDEVDGRHSQHPFVL